MFATRLRWVSITPLDMPVVPLENGSAARSSAGSIRRGARVAAAGRERRRARDLLEPRARDRVAQRLGRRSPRCAPALRELLGDLVGREQRVDRRDDRRRARPRRGTRPPSPALFGPSRPTASPGPMPSAASPDAVARDLLGELGVGRDGAARRRRSAPACRRAAAAPPSTYSVSDDGGDLDVGIRAAQDHPRSLCPRASRRSGGGGWRRRSGVSDGVPPVSSNVPSDSSSTPSTMWRTDTARYSCALGGARRRRGQAAARR